MVVTGEYFTKGVDVVKPQLVISGLIAVLKYKSAAGKQCQ